MSDMSDSEYRQTMDLAMEEMALLLDGLGVDQDRTSSMKDWEIIEFTCRKVRMLHRLSRATGISDDILKAVMNG